MIVLFLSLFLSTPVVPAPVVTTPITTTQGMDAKIKMLRPHSKRNFKWISTTIKKWAPKALPGVSTDLILAMIMKESSFVHRKDTVGNYGEWGVLQTIPMERHVQRAARKYRCTDKEIGLWHTYKEYHNGFYLPIRTTRRALDPVNNEWFKATRRSPKFKHKGRWYAFTSSANMLKFKGNMKKYKLKFKKKGWMPCRCSRRKGEKCNYPNVGEWRRGKYRSTRWKTMMFLRYSMRGALVTGLYEMAYWKNSYSKRLKKKFWKHPPKRYFKRRGYDVARSVKWWYRVKKDLGQYEWIVHYNYGGRLALSQHARWYPYLVGRFYKKLKNIK